MKAIIIRNEATQGRGIDAWELGEKPDPVPGPGQILMRVRAASLNYRDLLMARGHYGGPLKPDFVPLSDGAGEVAALGGGVTRWKVGDKVCAAYYPTWLSGPMRPEYRDGGLGQTNVDGTLAEYVLVGENGVVRMPANLSFEEASTLPCAAVTAWTALFGEGLRTLPGQSLLVLGTGGVSMFALAFGRAVGMRIIATTSTKAKEAKLRELGVSDVINYRDTPAWQKEVRRITNGHGVDHVVEVGGGGTIAQSVEATSTGGTVSLVGLLTGVEQTFNPLSVLVDAIRLQGVVVGSVRAFEEMNRAIEMLSITPIVDSVFPLEKARAALAKLEAATHFGKIVVRIG